MNPQQPNSYYRQLITVLAFMLSLISFSAHAENLTDKEIRSFITTLEKAQALEPEFEDLDDRQDDETLQDNEAPDFSKIFSSSIEELKGEDAYDRLEDLVQDHGFKNLDEWAATGDRIYGAWIAIEMAGQNPAIEKEMESAMAEIENSPHMSAQQKAQMRASMQAALGMTQQASAAPSADIEAVKPHLEALRAIAEDDED
ncbi:hypothetical protein [Marinobacter sp. 1_MG-2023]|uniref:hypothetical protein n=1 Tax=Marinobacter sp. 1_MG-2023 TaxID=3062627 RepID=UPI0026E26751|nr:hypothetical protein [Marinobacter sp. 1_MG-2023]MDO6824348.1 hypothetical protein [Marinobacter sp. 1_MG-2023]